MGTVLIIDDESAIRDYLSLLIRRLGHQTETAATAAEGLAKLAESSCQAVIADIYLPDSPLPEEWIRQLAHGANGKALVLISGELTKELNDCAGACGVAAFLSKPFELTFIRNILKNVFK